MNRKIPRLDRYVRLLSRFYETLIFLFLVKRVQGPHFAINHEPTSLLATRRRFLRNLAFICDFKKGGDSTAAIAVEDRPDGYKFWLASNEGAGDRVVGFLAISLEQLKHILSLPQAQRANSEAVFTQDCVDFALQRLRKESKLLRNTARRCGEFARDDLAIQGMHYENI